MTLPTRRCVLLFLAGLPVALLPVLVAGSLWSLWVAFVGVGLLLMGADALLAMPRRLLRLESTAPDTLYIGEGDLLRLQLAAPRWPWATRVEVLVDLGKILRPPSTQFGEVPSRGRTELEIPLEPLRRGTDAVRGLWLRWSGPLGLVRRQVHLPLQKQIAIVPNVRAVRAMALRHFGIREFTPGWRVERHIGDGSEFESLREYVPGMDHRRMHWKSSARHRCLLCQQFRAERNHQIILAIDSGHLMQEPLDGIPKLDHAINAALVLAYFCLRIGDRVGLFGFDEKVRCYAEPGRGVRSFQRVERLAASLEYHPAETNFTLGLAELSRRLRRRSLIILLADFVDVVAAELMIQNLDRLARRHLILFVALRDPDLEALAQSPPRSFRDLHRAVVAADLVRERQVVLRRLRLLGVQCIDAPPAAVNAQLINRYLEIKRREMV